MTPVGATAQVFDAIQLVKADAPGFCTNFFPVQKKLQAWVDHGELFSETRDGAAFFFRRDRDLWHFYFCAINLDVLRGEAATLADLKSYALAADLVGGEAVVSGMIGALEAAGFRRYSHLQRMARVGQIPAGRPKSGDAEVVFAGASDCDTVLGLLDASFDRFADQLPTAYEIEAALDARQIMAVRANGELAALLFFETQGFTSTLRYWAVAEKFRDRRLGSVLMRRYFESQPAVRRFILWVVADNENAVQKYKHYGYAADGLIDHVLANEMILA